MAPQYLLALESTCDETAAAVVRNDLAVLGSAVASQEELHQRFRGVVPELAARAHLERFLPVIDAATTQAGVALGQLDYVAVANTPGLAGSLLMGVAVAKALALALGKPLVAVNHLQAHIYACRMAAERDVFPCLGLIVSGGHTSLYRCRTPVDFEPLGGTIDDAAGEVFDKAAALLGLPFPGGPALGAMAERGDPSAVRFPRSLPGGSAGLDFSFSGLKTALRYAIWGPGRPITGPPPLTEQARCDLAAAFQEAVVDCLITRTRQALEQTGLRVVCVGGGVAANRRLRCRLAELAAELGAELQIAPPALCTDNAVMGAIAWERIRAGLFAGLELEILPGLIRPGGGGA